MNCYNSGELAFYWTGAVKDLEFEGEEDKEVVLVAPVDLNTLVLSVRFEQFAALALLVPADWKSASQFVR